MKILIALLTAIYAVSFFTDTTVLGATSMSPWYCYVTYNFIHVNILHLAVNSLFLYLYWKRIYFIPLRVRLVMVATIPVISAALSARTMPTIGISAVVMTIAGMYVAWFPHKLMARTVAIFTVSSLLTFFFAPHINTSIHVYSFGFALMIERVRRYLSVVISKR
jgi:membrane associated rhomboid family serine protease